MDDLTTALALLTAAANLLVGLFGALRWYQVREAGSFWPALRVAQAITAVFALYSSILAVAGEAPADLFLLYALLPVAVFFVAEQLRILAAQTVLDAREIEDAKAVGSLPEAEQRLVVRQILRRELGTMTAAALVIAFLALRAAGTVEV